MNREEFIRAQTERNAQIIDARRHTGKATVHARTEYECEKCGFATHDPGIIYDHDCPSDLDERVADVHVFQIETRSGAPCLFWRHEGGWDWLFITDPGAREQLGDLSDVADFDPETLVPLAPVEAGRVVWHRYGDRAPEVGAACLVAWADDGGARDTTPGAVEIAYVDTEGAWNVNGLEHDAHDDDQWADLPRP